MRQFRLTLLSLLLLFAGLAAAVTAAAAPRAATILAADETPASPNIPDAKLDAAAAAVERVSAIRQNYETQIAQAPPSDRQRLTAQGQHEIDQAVTDQGLSLTEYDAILDAARTNKSIRDKLLDRMAPK